MECSSRGELPSCVGRQAGVVANAFGAHGLHMWGCLSISAGAALSLRQNSPGYLCKPTPASSFCHCGSKSNLLLSTGEMGVFPGVKRLSGWKHGKQGDCRGHETLRDSSVVGFEICRSQIMVKDLYCANYLPTIVLTFYTEV